MTEALARLHSAEKILRMIAASEDPLVPNVGIRATKGLLFVQLYAVYEFSVVEGFRDVLREFNRRALPLHGVRRSLLPLAMDPQFDSVRSASVSRTWDTRRALVERALSTEVASVSEGLFPKDGSFFRVSQLRLLWELLGATVPVLPEERLQSLVEELVANRNAIAHGARSPEEVGGRYSVQDLDARVRETEALCTHVIRSFADIVEDSSSFN